MESVFFSTRTFSSTVSSRFTLDPNLLRTSPLNKAASGNAGRTPCAGGMRSSPMKTGELHVIDGLESGRRVRQDQVLLRPAEQSPLRDLRQRPIRNDGLKGPFGRTPRQMAKKDDPRRSSGEGERANRARRSPLSVAVWPPVTNPDVAR